MIYIFDELVKHDLLDFQQAIEKLEQLSRNIITICDFRFTILKMA